MTLAVWSSIPVLAAIAAEDARHGRIRNSHLLLLLTCIALACAAGAAAGDHRVLVRAASGAAVGGTPILVAALARPGGVGGGDVKLGTLIGALLGLFHPWSSVVGTGLGLLLAAAYAVVSRAVTVPLGPALAVSASAVVTWHALGT